MTEIRRSSNGASRNTYSDIRFPSERCDTDLNDLWVVVDRSPNLRVVASTASVIPSRVFLASRRIPAYSESSAPESFCSVGRLRGPRHADVEVGSSERTRCLSAVSSRHHEAPADESPKEGPRRISPSAAATRPVSSSCRDIRVRSESGRYVDVRCARRRFTSPRPSPTGATELPEYRPTTRIRTKRATPSSPL